MYKKSQILKSIRLSMGEGVGLSVAIKKAGLRSRQTLENWRKERLAIDRYIRACKDLGETHRNDAVENKLYDRLIKGEANSIEYIFYLSNRLSDRWKDKRALVNNQNIVSVGVPGGASIIEELKRLQPERAKAILQAVAETSRGLTEGNGKLLSQ